MTTTVIITDTGFGRDDWTGPFLGPDAAAPADPAATALDLPPETRLESLPGWALRAGLIRIGFPSFADGRGFTLARQLRLAGFGGRLRAFGHVLPDQYAMARRAGFDEVEIEQRLAERLTEDQWRARADWRAHDYQARLRRFA